MLLTTLLLAAGLQPALPTVPIQTPVADTVRTVRGLLNQSFCWGVLVLRSGQRLPGYLPVSAQVLEGVVPYYALPPDGQPAGRVKLISLGKVRLMRVKEQYYEVLKPGRGAVPQLARRQQSGAAELFMARASAPVPSLLGAAPVMGLPTSGATGGVLETWYLRRPDGEPVALTANDFQQKLAKFLADDPELAAQVAAPGFRFEEVEGVVGRYNQRKAGK